MTEKAKVSIGLLTYNSAKYFPRCLESLVEQDYSNIEIIIIDDASNDDSYVKCLEFSKNHNNITVLKNNENLGTFGSLDILLKMVSGDFFLWAVPDDDWSKNFVSCCISKLQETNCVAAMGVVKNIWDTPNVQSYNYLYNDLEFKPANWKLIKSIIYGKNFEDQRISYNQFIHGLIDVKVLKIVFQVNVEIWVHEELLVCFLASLGGLCFAKDCYHINLHSVIPLQIRNPGFAKIKFSWLSYLRGLFRFIKFVVQTKELSLSKKIQLCITVFFIVQKRLAFALMRIKIYLYESILKKLRGVSNELQL